MATGWDRMKLRLQLLVESDAGEIVTTEEVAQMERHSLRSEESASASRKPSRCWAVSSTQWFNSKWKNTSTSNLAAAIVDDCLRVRVNTRLSSARSLVSCDSAVRASIC
jgi:hypothetical protein